MRGMAIIAFLTALMVFLRQTGLIEEWRNREKKQPKVKPKPKAKEYDHQWNDDDN